MAVVLKGLVHGLAWTLATGAAVTLSWCGVHTVLAGTAFDPPRAVPVTGDGPARDTAPVSSSTHRPRPAPSPSPSRTPTPAPSQPSVTPRAGSGDPPAGGPAPAASASHPPGAHGADSAGSGAGGGADNGHGAAGTAGGEHPADGVVRGYDTPGGRVVLDIGKTSAALVSATPRTGWSMQVAHTATSIRVDFRTEGDGVTVYCTWHDHQQPQVSIIDS